MGDGPDGRYHFCRRAAEKLRGQGLAAGHIVIFARTNHFRPEDPQYHGMQPVKLPVAMADTGKLIAAARRGLSALYRPGYHYKKAGILLLELAPAAAVQGDLFAAADTPRSKARMRALTCSTGASVVTVSFAAARRRRAGKLRSEFLSPRFTTNWDELLRVS